MAFQRAVVIDHHKMEVHGEEDLNSTIRRKIEWIQWPGADLVQKHSFLQRIEMIF